MSGYYTIQKNYSCEVCGQNKVKVLRKVGQDTNGYQTTSERECFAYEASTPDEAVIRVFCSGCGIVYHEDSIY